ncbi:MAG: carboxymuconolactone decarboxylase family protein [Lautropia sp.]
MSGPRFPILEHEQMTERQREVADKIAGGPRGGLRGPFLALIHHPELADVVQRVGEHLRYKSALPLPLIELAILIVARHWTCQFEWFVHARLARTNTDLPEELIQAVQRAAIPPVLTDEQRIVHDFAIGILRNGTPSDAVYREAEDRFGRQGVLDLIATCGYYGFIAMLLNTAQIPLPAGETSPLREMP